MHATLTVDAVVSAVRQQPDKCCWSAADVHSEPGSWSSCAIRYWSVQSLAGSRSLPRGLQGGQNCTEPRS